MAEYSRDSFDDRIYDDLCQQILTFIPIEDKIRLECISKQFQKYIFNKQKVLIINKYFGSNFKQDNGLDLLFDSTIMEFNINGFENLLKKCKHVDSIQIELNVELKDEVKTQILDLITKYCNNLKSIKYDFTGIEIKTIESFGEKFGQSLEKIQFHKYEEYSTVNCFNTLLKLCPNIISLKNVKFRYIFIKDEIIFLPKLIDIEVTTAVREEKLFELFLNHYKDSVKSLKLNINDNGIQSQRKYLLKLSNMTSLKKLSINSLFTFGENKDLFNDFIKSLSVNIKQLTDFEFNPIYNPRVIYEMKNFKLLKQLKHLSLTCHGFHNEDESHITCGSFGEFSKLTKLELRKVKKGDDFYNNIDSYLPEIKVLNISHISGEVTDKSLAALSKLDNIQKFVFMSKHKFTDIGLANFITNCEQINYIEIYLPIVLGNKTADSLIALAVKKPKIQIKLRVNCDPKFEELFNNNKPINLSINFADSYC